MTNSVADIRDIKDIVPVPLHWWWWVLLAVVVLAALGALLWWRKRSSSAPQPAPPPQASPREIALTALARLQAEHPPVEMFYTRLADIVRQFIEGQFGLHAPERTTEEFLAEATLPAEQMLLLGAFLQEADLVKFARHRPGTEDMARAFAAAERFIREADASPGVPPPQPLSVLI